MKKRIMILGAGHGQLPLIRTCRDANVETVVVGANKNQPGRALADTFHEIDIRNRDELVEVARKERVVAAVTQVDIAVPVVAFISDALGLPSIGYETALKFSDKYVMRREAEQLGINVPAYFAATDLQEAYSLASKIGYPLMIKPADSYASKGVYKISDESDLEGLFYRTREQSNSGRVVMEEFIQGKEYVVDGFSSNKKHKGLVIGERNYFAVPNRFIPKSTIFTDSQSPTNPIEKQILAINRQLVEGLGLDFGITHAEYLYNELSGKVYLVEIAARGGGVFIASDLVPLSCGVDVNKVFIEYIVGKPTMVDEIGITQGAAAYFSYMLPEGEIVKIENTEEVSEIKGVHRAFFENISIGMHIPEAQDKSSRKGPILVKGMTKEDCYNVIAQVRDTLNVEVRTPRGEIQKARW